MAKAKEKITCTLYACCLSIGNSIENLTFESFYCQEYAILLEENENLQGQFQVNVTSLNSFVYLHV